MKIAAPKETQHNETRVAIFHHESFYAVTVFTSTGFQVTVEAQAGVTAFFTATKTTQRQERRSPPNILGQPRFRVHRGGGSSFYCAIAPHHSATLTPCPYNPPDSLLIGLLNPYKDKDTIAACFSDTCRLPLLLWSLSLVITRAQAMDSLFPHKQILAGYNWQ